MRLAPAPVALALATAALALAGCSGSDGGGDPALQEADFEELGLQADATTGILRGVVVDEAIRPIGGVLVVATAPGTNVSVTTKDDGLFGFDGLAPGTYFITVSKAGFATQQASGEVVAGEAEPKALKILLAADPSTKPYVEALHMDGFMECSVRPLIFATQCSLPGGADSVVNAEHDLGPVRPEWIQSEMRWDSTQAVGDELSLAIRCQDGDSDPAGKCPDGVLTIVRAEGHSPLVATINRTLADEWALGGPGGNPLIINLFAFGRSDLDPWDEQTIDPAQKPVTGNDCMQWGLVGQAALGFDPATCMRMTGPGLVLNQKIDVYSHVFYGYAPPEGWTFGLDGDPPAPPA